MASIVFVPVFLPFAGNPVSLDGASAGYKKFADKVKALAQVRVIRVVHSQEE